jgi:hypothetical protein
MCRWRWHGDEYSCLFLHGFSILLLLLDTENDWTEFENKNKRHELSLSAPVGFSHTLSDLATPHCSSNPIHSFSLYPYLRKLRKAFNTEYFEAAKFATTPRVQPLRTSKDVQCCPITCRRGRRPRPHSSTDPRPVGGHAPGEERQQRRTHCRLLRPDRR